MNKNALENYGVGYNELTDDSQRTMVGFKYQEFTRSLISFLLGSNPYREKRGTSERPRDQQT